MGEYFQLGEFQTPIPSRPTSKAWMKKTWVGRDGLAAVGGVAQSHLPQQELPPSLTALEEEPVFAMLSCDSKSVQLQYSEFAWKFEIGRKVISETGMEALIGWKLLGTICSAQWKDQKLSSTTD